MTTSTSTPATSSSAIPSVLIDVLVLVGASVLYLVIATQMAPFIPDDSFISYRYAENLAQGNGLRFNAGEPPVEGYSNFLWIIVLAGLSKVKVDIVAGSELLGGLFGILSIGLLWWLLRRAGRSGWSLIIPVFLLSLSGPFVLYSVSGMETVLFSFFLLALLVFVDRLFLSSRWWLVLGLSMTGILLTLTRPEGVVALPVVAACLLILSRKSDPPHRRLLHRSVIASVLIFAGALIIYHLVRYWYFEVWFPTPFLSKGAGGSALVDAWVSNLHQFFIRQTHYYAPMAYYYLAIGLPALVGAGLSIRQAQERRVELTATVLALIFAAIYLNFVDWMPGMRYYAPLVGLLLLPFSVLGIELKQDGAPHQFRANLPYILLGLVAAVVSLYSLATIRLDSQQLQTATQESLVKLGQWLRETMPAGSILAMGDVGATPYYSQLPTIDINPRSLTDRFIAENGWSPDSFF
jgi:arabinofuranosyltransferase